MVRKYHHNVHFVFMFSMLIVVGSNLRAEPSLAEIQALQSKKIELLAENQKLIESINIEIERAAIEHEANLEEIDSLTKYNANLSEQIKSQKKQIEIARNSISKIIETERKIPKLFLDMIEDLERSIDKSLPFQKVIRTNQIKDLYVLIKRPEISIAEKFQKILTAYEKENRYGKTIAAYNETITIGNEEVRAEILRVGRLALFYSTFSKEKIGMWDGSKKAWTDLNRPLFKQSIQTALSIAKNQEPPRLITLPFQSALIKIAGEK